MTTELDILRTVIAISALVFVGRVLGTLCSRFKMPEVIGEVSAGIFLGPFALGGVIILFDKPLVELNELMLAFAQIGGIIILFAAGLEFTFGHLRKAGLPSAVVGVGGVVVPMLLGYYVSLLFGLEWTTAMLIGAALTATSIAVTVRVLEELGQQRSEEGNVMVNAAVIDDVLGLAVLSVVTSIVTAKALPSITAISLVTAQALGFWFIILMASVFLLPRIIHGVALLRSRGSIEAIATGSAFGLAAAAASVGLHPIVGAFAAGMGLASSKLIEQIREFTEKLKIIFGPLFFAIIGTYINPTKMLELDVFFIIIISAVAVLSKILGCGVPAAYLLKSRDKGLKVGYGMASRGEVGFIIGAIGITSGIIGAGTYSALVFIIIATTFISPIMLRRAYAKSATV